MARVGKSVAIARRDSTVQAAHLEQHGSVVANGTRSARQHTDYCTAHERMLTAVRNTQPCYPLFLIPLPTIY
jgi:hypothetical protein